MILFGIFLALIFLHSLVSGWLERTILTAPMVFTLAGMWALHVVPEMRDPAWGREGFLHVAEVGLVLLLFTDASRADLRVLKSIRNLPARLLTTGMLLTLVLGMLAALLAFPHLSVWEAGILSAILAPTDAGLGQVIVNSPRVPLKIRQALNVEAGLNDGLSVPFLLFFIALAGPSGSHAEASLTRYIGEQVGFGALVGGGIGLVGGALLGVAHRRKWMAPAWSQLGLVALPLLCAVTSLAVDASMFIGAFVAGLVVQLGFKEVAEHTLEFTEEWGQMFNLSVFFIFGLLVARNWPQFKLVHAFYAALSLTVVRMVPVAVALLGTHLSRATTLFVGWFGPRGLASIVLVLFYLEQHLHQPGESTIRLTVMMTVFVSIFAHGISALPGLTLYARWMQTSPPGAAELEGSEVEIAGLAKEPLR